MKKNCNCNDMQVCRVCKPAAFPYRQIKFRKMTNDQMVAEYREHHKDTHSYFDTDPYKKQTNETCVAEAYDDKTQKNESAKGKKGLSGKKSKTGLTAQNKDPIKVNPARTKKALQILKKHYTVEKISIEIKYSPSAIYAVMNDKHEQVSQQLQTNCITMLKKHRSSKP